MNHLIVYPYHINEHRTNNFLYIAISYGVFVYP